MTIHNGSGLHHLRASLGQSARVHALDISLHTPRACRKCQVTASLGNFACLAGLAPWRRFGFCIVEHGEVSENDERKVAGGMFQWVVASGVPHASQMRPWRTNQKSFGARVGGGVSGVPPSKETAKCVECHWDAI
jgi:hypothetical protein